MAETKRIENEVLCDLAGQPVKCDGKTLEFRFKLKPPEGQPVGHAAPKVKLNGKPLSDYTGYNSKWVQVHGEIHIHCTKAPPDGAVFTASYDVRV